MSRSLLMRELRRVARTAAAADRHHLSTADALARRAEAIDRRAFLAGAGGAAIVGAAAAAMPRVARAAPRSVNASVAVIGAGMAGLACADELRRWGIEPTIYEAGDRAGGRCWSMGGSFDNPAGFPGQVVERGGELIDTLHTTMLGYARAFGFPVENLTAAEGDTLYYVDGAVYDEYAVIEEYRALVDAMKDDVRTLGAPTADAHTDADVALDHVSLREYLESRGAGNLIKNVIDVAYTGEFGREIDEQSSLNLLLYIHADNRSKFRPWGVFSDERYHLVGGNEQIPRALAAELSDVLSYGHTLVRVAKTAAGRYALTFDTAGRSVTTHHDLVVFALPFSVLRHVEFDASVGLPAWKRDVIAGIQYGTNAKMMVGFDARPWAAAGSNGSAVATLPNVQNTWETNFANATATRAVLTDFSGGARGASLDPRNVQREARDFLADLENVFPGARAAATRKADGSYRAHLEHWPSNPRARGSYICNQPGYFTTYADREAVPVDGLYFAGDHTSSFYEWQGFMEGAATTGLAAADAIRRIVR